MLRLVPPLYMLGALLVCAPCGARLPCYEIHEIHETLHGTFVSWAKIIVCHN
jgi:hypothetical protein